MNVYVILIAVVLVTLLVVFGRNPIEEAKKERENQGSKDPLIHATDEYFEKQQRYQSPLSGQSYGQTYNNGQSYNYPAPSYQQNPYQPLQGNQQQPQQNQQNAGEYYPPPAPGVPPSPLQQRQMDLSQPPDSY